MNAARVTQGGLWLLAALLLALTARPFLDRAPADTSAPAAPAPAARAPELADLELSAIESFAETLSRPLFTATRRPPSPLETIQGQAATPPRAAAKGERVILGKYVLRGVVVTPSQKLLLLKQMVTGQALRLKEGDAIEDWRIASITADQLVLARGGAEQKVRLKGAD